MENRKRCGESLSHLEREKSRRKRVAEFPIPPTCDLHLLIEEDEEVARESGTLNDSLENLKEDQEDKEMKDASQTISPTFLPQTLQKQDPSQQDIFPETLSPTLLPQTLHLEQQKPDEEPLKQSSDISPTPTLLPEMSIPQQQKPPTIGVTPSGARFQSIGLSPCLSLDNSLSLSKDDGTNSNLSLSPPMTLQEDDELPLAPSNRFTPKPLPPAKNPKPLPKPTQPSIEPTLEPSIEPTLEPSPEPSIEPTLEPTPELVLNDAIDSTAPTLDMTIPINSLLSPPKRVNPAPKSSSPSPTKTSPKPPPPKASPQKTPPKEFKEPERRPSPQEITPSRKSRRIQHTSSNISLSSLISSGILSPRDELVLFNHTGVLTADGWIEYNYDKYPTIEVWAQRVVTRAKKQKLKLTNTELFDQIEVKFLDNSQNTLRTCYFSECVDIFQGRSTEKNIAPHPTPILSLSRSIEELIPSEIDESYEELNDSGGEEPSLLREESQEEIIEELKEFDEFDDDDRSQNSTVSKLEEKAREEPTKKITEKKVDKSEKEEISSQPSQEEEPVKRDTILNTTPVRARRRKKKGPLTPRRQHFRFTNMTQDNWEPYERQLKEVDFMLDELDSQSQSQSQIQSQSSSQSQSQSNSLSAVKLPSMALDSSGDGGVPSQISVLSEGLWSPSRDDMEED